VDAGASTGFPQSGGGITRGVSTEKPTVELLDGEGVIWSFPQASRVFFLL
jgi:hypothetical protein